jgi:hypothetical protein
MIIVTSLVKTVGRKQTTEPEKMFFCVVETCDFNDREGSCYYQGDQRQVIEGPKDQSDIIAKCVLYEGK